MAIRVVLADGQALLRELLRRALEAEPDIDIVGEAADGFELLQRVDELQPDVAIVDPSLAAMNGVNATARLTMRHPGLRVLCLAAQTDPAHAKAMLGAGAAGCISKSTRVDELIHALRTVASGKVYLDPEVARIAVDSLRGPGRGNGEAAGLTDLGRRELEVLQLIAEGHSTHDIARRLFIAPATVDTHRRNVMRKLDLHSAVELTRYALRHGLASP